MTSIKQATPAEVRAGLASGDILLVDVREASEYAVERIHGALLFPLSTFDARAVPATGRRLVVHCAAGKRSMMAAQQLVAGGHIEVGNLEGGLAAWKTQGLPLIKVDPATGRILDNGRG